MYKGFCNGKLLFDLQAEEVAITAGKLSLEVNKAGSFSFTVYPSNPCYTDIDKFNAYIEVYKKDRLVFSGRVYQVNLGLYNEKQVICEGSLAFFNDSVIRPFEHAGGVSEFLQFLIDQHNEQVDSEKQFTLGRVTVTDQNDYIVRSSENYDKTLTIMDNRLLKLMGGYLWVRRENGVNYLDYLADFETRSKQVISFGDNIINITRESNSAGKITALIPLGAQVDVVQEEPEEPAAETEETEEGTEDETSRTGQRRRITIAEVNNGIDYVYDENAVEKYGWIFGTNTWDDVTEPENLLTKGREFLSNAIKEKVTIKIAAADLSNIGVDIDSINYGEYVEVDSERHGISGFELVKKQDIDLFKPSSNRIEVGDTRNGYVDSGIGNLKDLADSVQVNVDITKDYTLDEIVEITANLKSLISQTESKILLEVAESYATPEQIEEMKTAIEETAAGLYVKTDIYNEFVTDTGTRFESITNYFRWYKDRLIIGAENNPLTLVIRKDKISFYRDYDMELDTGLELAYFQSEKLYIPKTIEMPVGASLVLGKFAFIPRSNGNTSFKFIG